MRSFKILVQYDGTDFRGWQVQTGLPTVQGVLSDVLTRIEGQPVSIHGSGRTDVGVHALGQVASFRANKNISCQALQSALNSNLPPTIRVCDVQIVDDSFHARRSALRKIYHYRIFLGEVVSPFLYRFVWHAPFSVDLARSTQAALILIGDHDFLSFCSRPVRGQSTIRRMYELNCRLEGDLLTFEMIADGFLRQMARRIAGVLYRIGRGEMEIDSLEDLLAHPRANSQTPPLPARGLTLIKVDY